MASQFSLKAEKRRKLDESEDYDPKAKPAPDRAVPVKPMGEMTNDMPSYRENVTGAIAEPLMALGANPQMAGSLGRNMVGAAEWSPFGALTSFDDAEREAGAGNYLAAAMAGVGAIPAVGKEAKAGSEAVQAIVRPAQDLSGVFDRSARYEPRDLGVERFRPKKVPERTTDLLGRQDVFDKMMTGVEAGRPVADWYETGPLRKSFEDQFGPEEGLRRFDQFIDAVAATSPRSKVGENVRNASYYYGAAQPQGGRNSLPEFSELPAKAPAPYGHLAQNLHRMNVERTVFPGGAGYDFKQNPKPIAFAANLKGDPSVATVDTHAFRAPALMGEDPRFLSTSFLNEKGAKPRNIQQEVAEGTLPFAEALQQGSLWSSKPLPTEYAAFEDFYKKLGQEAGMSPAETQAASWVGHGATTGLESAPKSFMDFIEERVLKTARERGMDPRDVWRRALTGKEALLSLGGAAALGAGSLRSPRDEDQGRL